MRKEIIKAMYGQPDSVYRNTSEGEPISGWHLEDPDGVIILLSEIDDEYLEALYDTELEIDYA